MMQYPRARYGVADVWPIPPICTISQTHTLKLYSYDISLRSEDLVIIFLGGVWDWAPEREHMDLLLYPGRSR